METRMFLCLLIKNLQESTKHECFHVFSVRGLRTTVTIVEHQSTAM